MMTKLELDEILQNYNKVCLLEGKKAAAFLWSQGLADVNRSVLDKVLFLMDDLEGRAEEFAAAGLHTAIVSREEIWKLSQLYHLYEFADHFICFELRDQYGRLDNFVKTGLLTGKEALEALLCN